MPLEAFKAYLSGFMRGDLTAFDMVIGFIRHAWIRLQSRYNFYVRNFKFIDRLKGRQLTIVVLSGKYSNIWDVTFERLYAYAGNADVIVLNPDGHHGKALEKICNEYDFSYFESYTKNFDAVQNYVYSFIAKSPLILKMDDDVFITDRMIPNLIDTYRRLKTEGHDIGFIAPILNVNNVSYYYFLKTLNLIEEYTQRFEKPIFTRNWTKQRIWWDPAAAEWIWEHSLPLNMVAEIFEKLNEGKYELIPVRFSIGCILFERSLITSCMGILAYYRLTKKSVRCDIRQGKAVRPMLPLGDESYMNYLANDRMYGRFLALSAFAGHLCYWPQTPELLKWFEKNKKKLIEDVRR